MWGGSDQYSISRQLQCNVATTVTVFSRIFDPPVMQLCSCSTKDLKFKDLMSDALLKNISLLVVL